MTPSARRLATLGLAGLAAVGALKLATLGLARLECLGLAPLVALLAWPLWAYRSEQALFVRRLLLAGVTTESARLRRWLWQGTALQSLGVVTALCWASMLLLAAAQLTTLQWLILAVDAGLRTRLATAPAVITPHPGEAARLLGTAIREVEGDRFASADALCRATRCTVLLKGAGTLVMAPGELPVVVAGGNPGMASGGMGDVLTGVVAALMAQGMAPPRATAVGAVLHAAAADLAAVEGERGLLASDLFAHLRRLAARL